MKYSNKAEMNSQNKKRPHPSNQLERDALSAQEDSENKKNAITPDGEMPQKRFYRSRAHCNPLSHNDTFEYPTTPDLLDWSTDHYPNFLCEQNSTKSVNQEKSTPVPTVLDIGCGFGGLTTALSTILPNELILGLEIRAKVTEYVRLRILALRKENPGQYENCSVLRSNTMKSMPHFFRKKSLEKIFFCFPDPHFKKKNHSRRIVSESLLSEYAYFLKDGGRVYTITDVEDLHNWHLKHCRAHPMFRELNDEDLDGDPCVQAMYDETEEGKKVARAGTKKYYAVFEKINYEQLKQKVTAENFWEDSKER